MTSLEVRTTTHVYEALIGRDLLGRAGELIVQRLARTNCAIVSDANVATLFAERLRRSLAAAGLRASSVIVPPGEKSKNLDQAGAVCEQMVAAGLDRQSFVIGLGGGAVGDLSGFVAAIFHRGIPHVQIPTTLLAMVDSSIGGKTAVNTTTGKNLLGAVHQPALVIDDVDLLQTLPPRELRQGFAEIIKHAIIADAEMFAALPQLIGRQLDGLKPSSLIELIKCNVELKARMVAEDELDRAGERALLNFGHTVGHAIERAGDYERFLHGEAVSLGIVAASTVSMKKAGLLQAQRDAIVDLLSAFELPTRLPDDFPREKIFTAMVSDKKFESGRVRFVVTPRIGSACLSRDVTFEDIREAVDEL